MYKIRNCRMSAGANAGEHMPLLFAEASGLPELHAMAFALINDRDAGKSPSSIDRRLRAIGVGLTFLHERDIDLVERLATGTFLKDDELSGLAARCRVRLDGTGEVETTFSTNRYAVFIEYIVHRSAIYRHRAGGDQANYLLSALADFEKRAARVRPQAQTATKSREREGLEPEHRRLFLNVIHPDHAKNPFRKDLRLRNYALLLTSYCLGVRAGELLGVKRHDYDDIGHSADGGEARSLSIHRRPDDDDDKRSRPARQKTLGRVLIIHDQELIGALGRWLVARKDRKAFIRADRQAYLFVNEDGAALGYDGMTKIFRRLRSKFPALHGLCNHMLRHDWNDRWEEQKEANGWNDDDARADQTYAMGWSPTSKQPEKYPKKAIRKRSGKRIAQMAANNIGLPRPAND